MESSAIQKQSYLPLFQKHLSIEVKTILSSHENKRKNGKKFSVKVLHKTNKSTVFQWKAGADYPCYCYYVEQREVSLDGRNRTGVYQEKKQKI